MKVRIVPHYEPIYERAMFRVERKVPIIRIGKLKLWKWNIVDDCATLDYAKTLAHEIQELEKEFGETK